MTGTPLATRRPPGLDRRAVLGEDHDDVGALRDQVLDVAQLGLGRGRGVVGDVAAAAGLDGRLHRRLVPPRPALLLVVVQGHSDDAPAAASIGAGGFGAGGLGAGGSVPGGSVVALATGPKAPIAKTEAALMVSTVDRRTCIGVPPPFRVAIRRWIRTTSSMVADHRLAQKSMDRARRVRACGGDEIHCDSKCGARRRRASGLRHAAERAAAPAVDLRRARGAPP